MGFLKSTITKSLLFFQVGVQVFTKRPLDDQQGSFNPDDIITCLKKYPRALVKYLEHLVMDRRLQVRPGAQAKMCGLQWPHTVPTWLTGRM